MGLHLRPEIGPGAHRFGYDTLDKEEMQKMEKGRGVEAFFAYHVGQRQDPFFMFFFWRIVVILQHVVSIFVMIHECFGRYEVRFLRG